jgi:hypothetical protein
MSKRYSLSGTIRTLYALGLIAWLFWMVRLPDACRDPGILRWLFPAIGFFIAAFLAIVFCLDRDARRRAGPVARKDNQA